MINCENIHAGYGKTTVLDGVSFTAEAGETVAVLGPNGSGKTTLLRVISGVLSPFSGSISLEGRHLPTLAAKERARLAAVVPQRLGEPPRLTVREFVLLGRYPHLSWLGNYSRADYEAAETAMAETGVLPLAERQMAGLSGGETQRAALARALARQTRILLLDELSAGLDLARMIELFDLLETRRRTGCCLLLIMHDINLVSLYATRIIGLKGGRVIFDGPTEKVFTENTLSNLYDTEIKVFHHQGLGLVASPRSRLLGEKNASRPQNMPNNLC